MEGQCLKIGASREPRDVMLRIEKGFIGVFMCDSIGHMLRNSQMKREIDFFVALGLLRSHSYMGAVGS